jgi:hypothetical protein
VSHMLTKIAALLLAGLAASTTASAQQPATENPDALRPAVLLTWPVATRQRETVRLYFGELRRAIQTADTVTLAVLVPDFAIPAEERLYARRRNGCSSLSRAIARLKAADTPVSDLSGVRLERVDVTSAAQGDTIAVGVALVTVSGRTGRISVALTSSSNARSVGRVRGLLTALCNSRAVANGSATVRNGVPR